MSEKHQFILSGFEFGFGHPQTGWVSTPKRTTAAILLFVECKFIGDSLTPQSLEMAL